MDMQFERHLAHQRSCCKVEELLAAGHHLVQHDWRAPGETRSGDQHCPRTGIYTTPMATGEFHLNPRQFTPERHDHRPMT